MAKTHLELLEMAARILEPLLLREPAFLDAIPGYLLPDAANQARFDRLIATLRELGKMG
jgi:hypothetical protein